MRVFFLGAGASKSFDPNLPVARDLTLKYLLEPGNYRAWNSLPAPGHEIDYLRSLSLSQCLENEPLEEVLDAFDNHRKARIYLRKCLFMCLAPQDTTDTAALVDWLGSVRKDSSPILTTNYDMVLEIGIAKVMHAEQVANGFFEVDGLTDYGVPKEKVACGGPKYKNPVMLLKLHGSINWSFCVKCRMYSFPFYPGQGVHALAGIASCSNCSSQDSLQPVLVAPAKKKIYDDCAIQCIWKRAEDVLGRTTEIVFAGFSLNETDHPIRKLLLTAHRKARTQRVTVVDPKASGLRDRYEAVYGSIVETRDRDWKDYLAQNLEA